MEQATYPKIDKMIAELEDSCHISYYCATCQQQYMYLLPSTDMKCVYCGEDLKELT